MVVVVKKRSNRRPGLMMTMDGVSSMRSMTERSVSSNSLKKAGPEGPHTKPAAVSFAQDYGCPDTVYPPLEPPLTPEEIKQCFYSADDVQKFDKDRALTVLMYRTRKNNSVPWDDDVHSLRGLEENLQLKKDEKPRRVKRQESIRAVLAEQERLKSPAGQEELVDASRSMQTTPEDLFDELIRGVSCSHSKIDKHRAMALALKDQKVSGSSSLQGSARRLVKQVKTKLYNWASTSSRSLGAGIERSDHSASERGGGERHGSERGDEDADI